MYAQSSAGAVYVHTLLAAVYVHLASVAAVYVQSSAGAVYVHAASLLFAAFLTPLHFASVPRSVTAA